MKMYRQTDKSHPRFPKMVVSENPKKVTISQVGDDVVVTIEEEKETYYIKMQAVGDSETGMEGTRMWITDLEDARSA